MSGVFARPALAIAHTGVPASRTNVAVTRRLVGMDLERVIRDVSEVVAHHKRLGAKAEHAREMAAGDFGVSPRHIRTLLDEPHPAVVTRAEADALRPLLRAFYIRAAADFDARAAACRAKAEGFA